MRFPITNKLEARPAFSAARRTIPSFIHHCVELFCSFTHHLLLHPFLQTPVQPLTSLSLFFNVTVVVRPSLHPTPLPKPSSCFIFLHHLSNILSDLFFYFMHCLTLPRRAVRNLQSLPFWVGGGVDFTFEVPSGLIFSHQEISKIKPVTAMNGFY